MPARPRSWLAIASCLSLLAAAPAELDSFAAVMDTAMARMDHDMMQPPSGDADRDFAAMMIPHHQGAIDMAEAELRFGHDPMLRRLAQGMIVEQQQEIVVMRQALAALPPAVSSPVATSPHSHPTMNGMHK